MASREAHAPRPRRESLADTTATLREQLKAAREAAGLTQRALAERCVELAGGSAAAWQVTISRYEHDRDDGTVRDPTLRTAEVVAAAIGLRIVLAQDPNA